MLNCLGQCCLPIVFQKVIWHANEAQFADQEIPSCYSGKQVQQWIFSTEETALFYKEVGKSI